MADLSQHTTYTGAYSGLLNNFYVTLAIAGVCLLGYEIEVHVPRRRGRQGTFRRIPVRIHASLKRLWGEWNSGKRRDSGGAERTSQEGLVREKGGRDEATTEEMEARKRLGSREKWEFGYIYQPKAWRLNPAPPLPRWPLAWIWSSLKVRERDMPETCGLDFTLHARFLRGAFFYTLLQATIVLPILMPLHIFYAPDNVQHTSMTRASVSSLVESSGSRWLWVHAVLIWWVTITWTATVLWITWGGLAYRRREIKRLAERVKASREAKNRNDGNETGLSADEVAERWTVSDDCEGIKRYRTLMVSNVPPDMRDESTLRNYFDHYIHRHRVRTGQAQPRTSGPVLSDDKEDTMLQRVAFSPRRLLKKPTAPKAAPPVPTTPLGEEPIDSPVETVRASDEDEDGCTWESEVDEVILVRKLGSIASLRGRRTAVLRQLEIAHVNLAKRVLQAVAKHKAKHPELTQNRVHIHPAHDVEKGVAGLNAARNEALPENITKAERLERLVQALGGFVGDEPEQLGKSDETVWDVLHALPRELLDPYQSLTHLSSLFRKQNAPLIDYLSAKLIYLTLLLDEAREKPLSSYSASSTAFVTFRDARTARLALKILDSHPKRSLACHTAPAPDWTNLLWTQLGKSVYRSEFVRGWVVYLGVWAFTLIWIFPVSLLCALSTLTSIAGFIKPLQNFMAKHPETTAAITSLAPVILVAGLTIAICPILLVIANKAETINTRLGIHNSVLERFWKFLMVNGVVFFAIGQSAIEAYLTAFQNNNFDPLPIVASAFPTAAPYFASYVLLQTAIQPFFEIFRFGLPTIVYVFGTRVSTIPRQRNSRTAYPTFSHFSQVPQQLLGGAILHLFMLLNPLVIPFCLVYYGSCYLVWKRQFTYVYGRLYENNGRRTSIRVLRYSLDALALAQFVLFAFFILNKAKGHAISTGILIGLTLIEKLIITRALRRRFDNLDVEEADILSPPVPREQDDIIGLNEEPVEDWNSKIPSIKQADTSVSNSRVDTIKNSVSSWAGKWGYASSHRSTPTGYRKPIPFDHVFFSTLDSKISFEEDKNTSRTPSSTIVTAEEDVELKHEPNHAIVHQTAQKLVTGHHGLRPWEDIPPYQRSRGYNDQPAYTDDYDDFLWLPRDPLSTLDLDDTVEMRLSLTTSAGGSGRIGDWPPIVDSESDVEVIEEDKAWQDRHASIHSPTTDRPMSSDATSESRLMQHMELSPHIGSEVDEGFDTTGLVRRGTKRVGEGLSSLFRRPRSGTNQTHRSETGISMRTLSIGSTRSYIRPMSLFPNDTAVSAPAPLSPETALTSSPLPAQPPQTAPAAYGTGTSGGTGSTSPRPGALRRGTDESFFLSPSRTSTPRLVASRETSDGMEHVDLNSPPRQSQVSIQLGRSPSGRRPSRMRSDSKHGDSIHTPQRTASILSPARSRSIMGRDRSTSVLSAQQHALMESVMHEEALASKDSKEEEMAEHQKDKEELEKEKARMQEEARIRRGSISATAMGATVGRSASRIGGDNGLLRSMSLLGRATSSASRRPTDVRRTSRNEANTPRPDIGARGPSQGSARSRQTLLSIHSQSSDLTDRPVGPTSPQVSQRERES